MCYGIIYIFRDVPFCRIPTWAEETPAEAVSRILITRAHASEIMLWPYESVPLPLYKISRD